MKKIFFLLMLVMTSISALADTTCRVYGAADNVATLKSTSAVGKAGFNGNYVSAKVELTKKASAEIAVVIEVIDAQGNVVANGVYRIPQNSTNDPNEGEGISIYGNAIKSGTTYRLSIANASCE